MTGQTVSHYRIGERLGRGGMGVVYEAEDLRLGRKVAVKFLPEDACCDPESVQRFLREARAISSLNHPHICTLHDIGAREGQQFMVMERLEGEPLKARLARGPLPLDEVLAFGEHIADALDAAHAKGIVHRDLKPANLFVTTRGQVKVLDFGVAKLTEPGRASAGAETIGGSDQVTMAGSAIGTIHYMSPEQARGLEIDGRSDLFSLGIVLYEMATGKAPFQGATAAVVFEGILSGVPPAPSQVAAGVPEDLDRIVFRALEKDREMRYQSAADLRADLRRLRKALESGRTLMATAGATPRAPLGPPDLSASSAPSAAPASSASSAPSAAPVSSASSAPSAALVPSASSASSAAPVPSASSVSSAAPVPFAASASLPSRRSALWIAAPLVTIGVMASVLLWRSQQAPALADRDLVVVSEFVNRTGDTMFDDTLDEALGVQLRQSPFLNVLNEQQQQSTLRLMGRDPMSPVRPDVGRELCQRAAAKALLGGTIASLGSAYLVTLSAQDCVTGDILAEEQVQASGKEEVLAALSGAVRQFRERLGESLASIQRYDAPVEQATTPSLEALKAYSQGTTTRRTEGDFESVPFFRRAIELDPDFALAFARLGTVYSNLGQAEDARAATTKAYELRERVSDRERYYIEARYHTAISEDLDRAIDTYKLLLATYPDDYGALTNTGLLLRQQGRVSEAIPMLEAATKAGPDQPNAHANLGYVLMDAGRFEDARLAFEQAVKLQDSTSSRSGLLVLATLTGDDALAQAQVEAVKGRRDEVNITGLRVQAALFRGRVREAWTLADEWMAGMVRDGRATALAEPAMGTVLTAATFGLAADAERRFTELRRGGHLTPGSADEQLFYAAFSRNAALARQVLSTAIRELPNTPDGEARKPVINAALALAEGRPAEAQAMLDPPAFTPKRGDALVLWAVAQSLQGRHADALRVFEYLLAPPAQSGLNGLKPWLMVQRARALEALGRHGDAQAAYAEFLEFWSDADEDVPLLVDARREAAKQRG
ncbi:MAG: protein kinase [Vicinamibacterales bacterium]